MAYVIVTAPAVTPFTMPVVEPTVALPLLALQLPPGVALVKVIEEPSQTAEGPVIAAGNGLTVIVEYLAHPVEEKV